MGSLGTVNQRGFKSTPAAPAARRVARAAGVYNVRDYGAVGDRVTDDTDAFLACIAEAGAANGNTVAVVFVPSGRYFLTDELVLPDGVQLDGAGVASTALCWKEDIGAGKYAVRCEAADPWGPILTGLWLTGPGFYTAFNTTGEHPCDMRGVDLPAGGIIRNCRIDSFDINVRITQNHEEIHNCKISGGYYNIYYDEAGSSGDQVFTEIQFVRALHSHVAIHPAAQFGGVHWVGIHFADCPYAFYGEDGPGGGQMLVQSVFIDCAFEGYGNGCFYDAKGSRGVSAEFIGCGEGSGFAAAPIVGNPSRAVIDAYSVNIKTDGGFPAGVGDDAMIRCAGPFICEWEHAENAIVNARAAGKPLVIAQQALSATGTYSSGTSFCEWEMFAFRNSSGRGYAGQYELLEMYLDGYCQRYDATAGVVAGVTLTPVTDDSHLAILAVRGSVPVKTTDGTLGYSQWAKPATDTAKRGEVILATGPTDGPAIGWARANTSGGTIDLRLRGLV